MSNSGKREFSAWGHLSLEAVLGAGAGGCGLRWRRAAAAGGGLEAAPHPTARGLRAELQQWADPGRRPALREQLLAIP